MKNSEKQNARLEIEDALKFVLFGIMVDDMALFKQFNDIPPFQKCPADKVFSVTYNTLDGRGLKIVIFSPNASSKSRL